MTYCQFNITFIKLWWLCSFSHILTVWSCSVPPHFFTHHFQFHRCDPHDALLPFFEPSDPSDWHRSQSHTSWNQTHKHLERCKKGQNCNDLWYVSSSCGHQVVLRLHLRTLSTADPFSHCNVIDSNKTLAVCVSMTSEHHLWRNEEYRQH